MQNSSAFQFLALDTIHESATNPRRTFEESKLHELAASIRQHGLIQPITVRPNSDDKLTGFALRLVLTAHTPIPRESEIDFLTEAEAAFAPSEPKKTANKKAKAATPIKTAQKTTAAKKTKAKKQAAA